MKVPIWRGKSKGGKKKQPTKKKVASKQLVTKAQLYRAIHRQQEVKQVNLSSALTYYNANMNEAGDLKPLLPPLIAGVDNQNRVGQEVKPVKLVVRGYLIYNFNTGNTAQVDSKAIRSRMLIWQNKSIKSYGTALTNYSLLENGVPAQFTGATIDLTYPLNKDDFTFYYDKQHTFLKPFGLNTAATPSSTASITSMNSSLFHPFTFTFTKKHLPAKLFYQDGSNLATNFAPYLTVGYADLFNTGTPDVINKQIAMEYTSTLYFTDS